MAQKDQVNRPTGKALETMKKILKSRFITTAHVMFGREVEELTEVEIYKTIAATAKQSISDNWIKTNKQYAERKEKQIYYFSIEFLLGRLLKSNLINLGIEEALKEVLGDFKLNLSDAYEAEPDAGLGNGGLGRLAACFIDSLAAHRYPGHGCTIRYQYATWGTAGLRLSMRTRWSSWRCRTICRLSVTTTRRSTRCVCGMRRSTVTSPTTVC